MQCCWKGKISIGLLGQCKESLPQPVVTAGFAPLGGLAACRRSCALFFTCCGDDAAVPSAQGYLSKRINIVIWAANAPDFYGDAVFTHITDKPPCSAFFGIKIGRSNFQPAGVPVLKQLYFNTD